MNSKGFLIGLGVVLLSVITAVIITGSFYYPVYEDGEVYLLELVIFDRLSGNIIGNPDFTPSFDHVSEQTIENKLKEEFELLGQSYQIVRDENPDERWASSAYWIEDTIYVSYSEGFMVLYLDAYEGHETLFHHVIKSLEYILLNDRRLEIFPSQKRISSFEAYNEYYPPGTVAFKFDYHADEGYRVWIEDMKMGH